MAECESLPCDFPSLQAMLPSECLITNSMIASEIKDQFYCLSNATITKILCAEPVFLIGDFSARVGDDQMASDLSFGAQFASLNEMVFDDQPANSHTNERLKLLWLSFFKIRKKRKAIPSQDRQQPSNNGINYYGNEGSRDQLHKGSISREFSSFDKGLEQCKRRHTTVPLSAGCNFHCTVNSLLIAEAFEVPMKV